MFRRQRVDIAKRQSEQAEREAYYHSCELKAEIEKNSALTRRVLERFVRHDEEKNKGGNVD
jgi:hypothetical protein